MDRFEDKFCCNDTHKQCWPPFRNDCKPSHFEWLNSFPPRNNFYPFQLAKKSHGISNEYKNRCLYARFFKQTIASNDYRKREEKCTYSRWNTAYVTLTLYFFSSRFFFVFFFSLHCPVSFASLFVSFVDSRVCNWVCVYTIFLITFLMSLWNARPSLLA